VEGRAPRDDNGSKCGGDSLSSATFESRHFIRARTIMPDDIAPPPQAGPALPASLPHNLEAEQFLLGAVLLDNEAIERVDTFLRAEHFYDPVHARIYEVMKRNIDRGLLADPVVLKAHFATEGTLAELGGEEYLRVLAASVPSLAHIGDYGRAIFETYQRRGLVHLGHEVAARALDQDVENGPREQIEEAEQQLYSLAEVGRFGGGFAPFREAAARAIELAAQAAKTGRALSGVTTGIGALDRRLGGLQKSDLVIIAGRPGMGKTALATNIAFNASRRAREHMDVDGTAGEGANVAFFSLEMSSEQLAQRIISGETGIPSDKVRKGEISQEDYETFCQKLAEIERIPLFIDETGALSIAALAARARRLKRTEGLGLIVIDYIQLMNSSVRRKSDNRVLEVTEITTGLKALAKELNVPIVALSQLSRAVESRDDKRPLLSDLRESGSIEQDADVVLFVYREAYYLPKEPPDDVSDVEGWMRQREAIEEQAEVRIAKHRHGPTGDVKLRYEGYKTKFSDPEDASYDRMWQR
jgi:replicative DNA helicase